MELTAYALAQRFVGMKEIPGPKDNPFIQWSLTLCGFPSDVHDEVPNCSAFANAIAWLLRLPRSKSARARSWLTVGTPITLRQAAAGNDVVVLKRGKPPQPGAEVLDAVGHVGFFAGLEGNETVLVLGGNQGDAVSIARFDIGDVLGVRRLA